MSDPLRNDSYDVERFLLLVDGVLDAIPAGESWRWAKPQEVGGGVAIVNELRVSTPALESRIPPSSQSTVHSPGLRNEALYSLRDSLRGDRHRWPTTHPLRCLPLQPRPDRRYQMAGLAPASPGRGAGLRRRWVPQAVDAGRSHRPARTRRPAARSVEPARAMSSPQRQ
jgi:hypothetical protein